MRGRFPEGSPVKAGKLRLSLGLATGSAILTSILFSFPFSSLEARLYDLRLRYSWNVEADPRITLISIDPESAKALDELAPFTLPVHVEFLRKLAGLRPKAVGYLVNLNHVHRAGPEEFDGPSASGMIQTVRAMERLGIPVLFGTSFDVTGEILPPYPLSSLPHALAVLQRDGNQFANDKVTRRALVEIAGRPAFQLSLGRMAGLFPENGKIRSTFTVTQVEGRYNYIRFPTLPRNPYPIYSFSDVLQEKIPAGALKDRLILVGTIFKDNANDFALTPIYDTKYPRPRLELHADILSSFLRNDGLRRVPEIYDWLLTFLLVLLVTSFVLHSSPVAGLGATLGLAAVAFFMGIVTFQPWFGYWVKLAHPLVGTLLAYYLIVPYCLIREYEGRWKLEREKELEKEVEELKTHFLFLVTHDLKTPVARIQGLAEMLKRKAADRLVERDLQTIAQIHESTEELNHFISSVLELHTVESNRLKPRFESKDLNQLIERTIEGHKAQAKARGIRIEPKLEPLFPVKIDPGLMAKILNNLLSNAIQYSPDDSTVTVESCENGAFVEVTVRDEGIGMTEEELSNLFTRFYRAKNDLTAKTRGTGLGLYLTKFFVEAHSGTVRVVSETGKGSAFTISLPLG